MPLYKIESQRTDVNKIPRCPSDCARFNRRDSGGKGNDGKLAYKATRPVSLQAAWRILIVLLE